MSEPSTPEFLDASYLAYGESQTGGAETGSDIPDQAALLDDQDAYLLQAGLVGWTPIAVQYTPADGFYGVAYQLASGQIIISFEGTDPDGSAFGLETLRQDLDLFQVQTPDVLDDALSFAEAVIGTDLGVGGAGISLAQIYVTGHSLGGTEAEYVSAQLGLAGEGFGGTGVPGHVNSGTQPNFVTYVDYGDPVGNYASNMTETTGEPGAAPFSGMDHVGTVQMTGSPTDAAKLTYAAQFFHSWLFPFSAYLGSVFIAADHLLPHYAADLGVIPFPPSSSGAGGTASDAGTALSPADVLAALDAQLGTPGQQDLAAATAVSGTEVQSPNFTVTINVSADSVTITQNLTLVDDSGTIIADPGTDVITLDPTTQIIRSELFSDSTTGTTDALIPDAATADDGVNIGFSSQVKTIEIVNPSSYTGTISNLQTGDTIDLAGTSAKMVTLSGGALTVQLTDGASLTPNIADLTNGQSLSIATDGSGGTDISAGPIYNFTDTGLTLQYFAVSEGVPFIGATPGANKIAGFTANDQGQSSGFVYDDTTKSITTIAPPDESSLVYNAATQQFDSISQMATFTNVDGFVGVSTSGEVAGNVENPFNSNSGEAIISQGGAAANVPVLPDINDTIFINGNQFPAASSSVYQMNINGAFVGGYNDLQNNVLGTYLYNNGAVTPIDIGSYADATAINAAGNVAGTYFDTAGTTEYGFIDTGGNITSFTLPGAAAVTSINDNDVVAGYYTDSAGNSHIFTDAQGVVTSIGNFGTSLLDGVVISDSGLIVGNYFAASETHGVIFNNGVLELGGAIVPGASSAIVQGINDSGQVVGTYTGPQGNGQFIYQNGTVTTLNLPNVDSVNGINDDGTIYGTTHVADSGEQLFVATPNEAVACFAEGTAIATPHGPVAVQTMKVGDLLCASNTGIAKITWIGHRRIDCRRHPRPDEIWPVRIAADAFGAGLPQRDLWLSPDHAVFSENILIPIKYLINGSTIIQEPRDEVTYWHVELARHDLICAEGLPCESFLDTGNRPAFSNTGGVVQLHADFAPGQYCEAVWEAMACAPIRIIGPGVDRTVARLRRRARELGFLRQRQTHRPATTARLTSDLARLVKPGWYLAVNDDVAAAGQDALAHYIRDGRHEGRLPCPETDLIRGLGLIEPGSVIFTMPDVIVAGIDPVAHFCTTGWREGRPPNPYFDILWYRNTCDVPAGMNPLLHYVLHGEPRGHRPSRHFDPAWYAAQHALAPSVCALAHYLKQRRRRRVSPLPTFDIAIYGRIHAENLRPDRDPYAHFLAVG